MIKRILKAFLSMILKIVSKPYVKTKEFSYTFLGSIRARIYKHLFAECGSHFVINGRPLIFEPEKISVGNHVTINNGVQLCPRGNIILSDYVTLSRGSQITAGELDMNCWADEGYKKHIHTHKGMCFSEKEHGFVLIL